MKLFVYPVVLALAALLSNPLLACSCARPKNLDFWVDRSASIIVATPIKAEVVEKDGHRGEIHASMQLLDVLKGPAPEVLPIMTAVVEPEGAACEGTFMLGSAYVLFLDDVNQPSVIVSTCSTYRGFRTTRVWQEVYCFEGIQWKDERCSPAMLDMLREATVANAKYGFGDHWLQQNWNWVTSAARTLRENAEARTRISVESND